MSTPASVTHADLAPSRRTMTDLGSKTGLLLTVLCILSGLLCFILCLIAEASRSEVTWVAAANEQGEGGGKYECVYNSSGKTPLMCAAIAFVGLAIAVVVQHSFMLIAITRTTIPTFLSWDPDRGPVKSLTSLAGFFFISTWVCFVVGEAMLLIGLSVESGHLKNWSTPRPSCLVLREGIFTAAGVFALITVFLATGLYATALRLLWFCEEQEMIRRQVLETAVLYASPPTSPPHPTTIATTTIPSHDLQNFQLSCNKQSNLV